MQPIEVRKRRLTDLAERRVAPCVGNACNARFKAVAFRPAVQDLLDGGRRWDAFREHMYIRERMVGCIKRVHGGKLKPWI